MRPLQTRRVLAVLLALVLRANVSGQTEVDTFDPNLDGPIYNKEIVVQSDGKILVAGDFTTVTPNGGTMVIRNRIARFFSDGLLDSNFNPNANNTVNAVALQPDGKILVGGYFTSIGGKSRNRIARLDPLTGAAEESFNPNANDLVQSIVVQSDGKILVGGFFTQIDGQTRNYIARLNSDGTLDQTFNPNPDSSVVAIAVQQNNQILVAGYFGNIGGLPRNYIARLDSASGIADGAFNANANTNSFVNAIAVQSDGKIVIGGAFKTNLGNIGGQPRNRIARLNRDGTADDFDPNANCDVESLALESDGKILVGGCFTNIGGQPRNRFARLDPVNGLSDGTDPSANDIVKSIAIQADGKVLIGGSFNTLQPDGGQLIARNRIARLLIRDSSPIPTPSPTPFGRGMNLSTRGYVQTGDRVMIAGIIVPQSMKVVVRGLGQSMEQAGITDYLTDPILTIYNSNSQPIASNDNWQDDANQAQQLRDLKLQPNFPNEAAMVINLSPGVYTAIISGKNQAVGTALVEWYCNP